MLDLATSKTKQLTFRRNRRDGQLIALVKAILAFGNAVELTRIIAACTAQLVDVSSLHFVFVDSQYAVSVPLA